MHNNAPSMDNPREYVAWLVKNAPEFELHREWFSGDIDQFSKKVGDFCAGQLERYKDPDDLAEAFGEISELYNQLMIHINANGGLQNLPNLDPQISNAWNQAYFQFVVFQDYLINKFKHQKTIDIVQLASKSAQ